MRFWLILARTWGCTLREARARCDSAEFTLWQAFYKLDPWGPERDDLRQAITSSLLVNVNTRSGGRKASPADFMPFAHKAEQTDEEIEAFFVGLANMTGGAPNG